MIKFLLPIVAGLSIVLQGTLNRHSSNYIGLPSVILLNAMIFLFFSAGFWALYKFSGTGGNTDVFGNPFSNFQWWQILPGFFGFLIVFSTPLSIKYLGANSTFAVIICTQLIVSMVWDSYMQKVAPTIMSLVGVAVMVAGLFVLIMGKRS